MTSKADIINSKCVNVDVSAYKIVTALDDLKRKQMEKKKSSRRRQHSISQHQGFQRKEQEDASLDQIRRNYHSKIKAFPKLDCYQRLKGYLQLQDQEIKRVKNNTNQPTYGTLYPQNDEENRLSSFLVGESPMRRNYGNNRYQSESPARLIQDQTIPDLQDYLKDRKVRKILQDTTSKKEKLEMSIQELENKKFKLQDTFQDHKYKSVQDLVKQQVPKFIPQKYDAQLNIKKLNTEKQYQVSEEIPMNFLKDKLLTDNIKSTGEMYSSINPLQHTKFSQYQMYSNKKLEQHNQYLIKALQKSDHNRRQTLFHKHLLYNTRERTMSSQKDLYNIQQQLNDNLNDRINYNEKLTQQFHKLIKELKDGQVDLGDDDLSILADLRYIILKGRNLNNEDFLELMRLRNCNISQNCLNQIIIYLFPESRNYILQELNQI